MEVYMAIADALTLPVASFSCCPARFRASASASGSVLAAAAAVRFHTRRTPRNVSRRKRRSPRRSLDGSDDGFSSGGDDGPFGGGGSNNGRGWGFGSSGENYWGNSDSSPSSSSDPAFDFVFQVVCWIALSNCAQYAVMKVARFFECKEKAAQICV